jgi:hypothetical protein
MLSDQQILRALRHRREVGDLSATELWAELYRRHSTDSRLLVLCLHESLFEGPIPGSDPGEGFVLQVERLASTGGAIARPLADLLAVGQEALRHDLRGALARRLAKLRARLPTDGDPGEASDRLRALADEVAEEYSRR